MTFEEAHTTLRTKLPGWKIYTMGERHPGSAYEPCFCGLEPVHGGKVSLGEGKTLTSALTNAVKLALEDERRNGACAAVLSTEEAA